MPEGFCLCCSVCQWAPEPGSLRQWAISLSKLCRTCKQQEIREDCKNSCKQHLHL